MGVFSFENQSTKTFLSYKLAEGEELDRVALGMLTNNTISALAKTNFAQKNNDRFVRFEVSAQISMDQIFNREVKKKQLLQIFSGIVNAVQSIEDYMLDPNELLLDPQYIFVNISDYETTLICLPVRTEKSGNTDLKIFLRNILFNTRFDQTENCEYVAKLINYINGSQTLHLDEFSALIESMKAPAPELREQSRMTEQKQVAPVEKKNVPERKVEEQIKQPALATSVDAVQKSGVKAEPIPQKLSEEKIPAMAMPVPQKQKKQEDKQPVVASESEKEISLFYLLQHYNKENAAIYKAQKERKKGKEEKEYRPTSKKGKQTSAEAVKNAPSFAVPGQPVVQAPVFQPESNKDRERDAEMKPAESIVRPVPQNDRPQTYANSVKEEARAEGAADFGDTNFLFSEGEDDGSTVILGQENQSQRIAPQLLRKKNNEKIPVDKDVYRIGRDFDFNDYAISDNRYVGHSHCHIITRGGEYFVVDDNSKNHTSVNGVQLMPGQEAKLAHGYILRVADEEFEFRLY